MLLMRGSFLAFVAATAGACSSSLGGDGQSNPDELGGDGGTTALDGSGGNDTSPPDAGVSDVGHTTDCIIVDRASEAEYPPAGVRATFRVLDCGGLPVRQLTNSEVHVINDEKGEPFGAGQEGGGVSGIDRPSEFALYSILALDMSDSIFNNDAVDAVIDGARVFVQKLVSAPA